MTSVTDFQQIVWNYYKEHKRSLPWRETFDPYKIWLSEIMLQQTQIPRVIKKYELFLQNYPTIDHLVHAEFSEILKLWKGLGYNRRARFLQETANIISKKYNSQFPNTKEELLSLPGIGDYTASAISTFAFKNPEIVIETNIRTAIIHHFVRGSSKSGSASSWEDEDKKKIGESVIQEFIDKTLDRSNPRDWYYALMDYGAFIKKTVGNLNRMSKKYTTQSKFEGSRRQVRGRILEALISYQSLSETELFSKIDSNGYDLHQILRELEKENLILKEDSVYKI